MAIVRADVEEIVRVTCRHHRIDDEATRAAIMARVSSDLERTGATSEHEVIRIISDAVKPHSKPRPL